MTLNAPHTYLPSGPFTGPIEDTYVLNRGLPPQDFLEAIVAFGQSAPDEIFLPNTRYDIYSLAIDGGIMALGETSIPKRRAVMMELMRVHGMFESSGVFTLGVDTSNPASMADINRQETGVWQVSFDSTDIDPSLIVCLRAYNVDDEPQPFIDAMKAQPKLACEYYARLVRFSVRWAGPLLNIGNKPAAVIPWLSSASVAEFLTLL